MSEEKKEYAFTGHYILVDKKPIREPDILKWAEGFNRKNRHVAHTECENGITVSTVFLGVDHRYSFMGDTSDNVPILFETMVFGGDNDGLQQRYCTWKEAETGHNELISGVL